MSFAGQTKKELTMVEDSACCQQTEIQAMIAWNGIFHVAENRRVLDVETENVATARRIYTLLKGRFDVHPEVVVRKKMRLKKNNVYAIRMPAVHAEQTLKTLGWTDIPRSGAVGFVPPRKLKNCCKRAFLRGAFLAGGSVNDPGGSSYHLEIGCNTADQVKIILVLMNHYGLNAKQIQRKHGFVVYLKEGEKIVEFLSIIGAHQALLKFEDVRILKGMRNQVNRLVNCETANMNKTIAAAVRQLEVIAMIDAQLGLDNLPTHLREAAELRLRYPEVNLQELSDQSGNRVSKSGLNHRFRKLEEIARGLRGSISRNSVVDA